MTEDDMLELVSEQENEFDNCAIALHFNGSKKGFFPAEENKYLSIFMDAGFVEKLVEISHLKTQAAAWENVHIAIYLLKEITNKNNLENLPYLTPLETPH